MEPEGALHCPRRPASDLIPSQVTPVHNLKQHSFPIKTYCSSFHVKVSQVVYFIRGFRPALLCVLYLCLVFTCSHWFNGNPANCNTCSLGCSATSSLSVLQFLIISLRSHCRVYNMPCRHISKQRPKYMHATIEKVMEEAFYVVRDIPSTRQRTNNRAFWLRRRCFLRGSRHAQC
jgi:hypothetical protein